MKGTRKLLSILFCDIKGYTAIMESDEDKALNLIAVYKQSVEKYCTKHNGQLIQYMGDGALIVFTNSVDAVQFGIELQKDLLQNTEINNRIGIHTGEVVMKDNNVHGDSVNVASRIESIASPGSVIISKTTYDQVKNKNIFVLQSLGNVHFKNQEKPMEVFAVVNDPLIVPKKSELRGKTQPKSRLPLKYVVPAIVALVILAIFFGKNFFSQNAAAIDANPWLGTWEHEMEVEHETWKSGNLIFREIENELTGEAEIWYDAQKEVSIKFNLTEITITANEREIAGNWASDLRSDSLSSGNFLLRLAQDDKNFTGSYSTLSSSTTNAWRGQKTN